jgi:hypothetical protein
MSHRHYSEALHDELFFVPLFVKAPGQRDGRIDDQPAQSIDILPTVLELIGAQKVETDGRSLLSPPTHPSERLFFAFGTTGLIAIPQTGPTALVTRAEREARELRLSAQPTSPHSNKRQLPIPDRAPSDATVFLIPPVSDASPQDDSASRGRAHFVHGVIELESLRSASPEVVLTLNGERALVSGTFLSRQAGAIVFEGLVQSPATPAEVYRSLDVALVWKHGDGSTQETAPRVDRAGRNAESFLTTANAFWYAYWQGHPASVSCSDPFRRAFLESWRDGAVDTAEVRAPAQLVAGASSICRDRMARDTRNANSHASDPCRCSVLESAILVDGESKPQVDSNGSTNDDRNIWEQHWTDLGAVAGCPDDVRRAFDEFYQPRTSSTWPRPPFVLLRAAIEACRNEREIDSDADIVECDCFEFGWADAYDDEWTRQWMHRSTPERLARAAGLAVVNAAQRLGLQTGQ